MFSWPDALAKAQRGEEIVRERLKGTDVRPREIVFEYLGLNALGGPTAPLPECEPNEMGLRIAAKCNTRAEADAVRREVTHLWTLGGLGSAIAPPDPAPARRDAVADARSADAVDIVTTMQTV